MVTFSSSVVGMSGAAGNVQRWREPLGGCGVDSDEESRDCSGATGSLAELTLSLVH